MGTPETNAVQMDDEFEYFVIVQEAGLRHIRRHFRNADAAKADALATGGKLYRGRTQLLWDTLQEIAPGVDDAY